MDLIKINQEFKLLEKKVKVIGTVENPWFCGKDLGEVLEYSNIKDALHKNVSSEYKKHLSEIIDISVGMQNEDQPKIDYHSGKAVYLSEAGVYEFIFASKTEFAKQVKKWVFEEVLPSIRKTGSYHIEQKLQEKEKLLLESQEALNKQQKALELAESKNLKLKQKIQNDKVYKLEGWVYLATNEQYALQNHFRFGKTTNLKSRISGYKTGRTKQDLLYFVFTYKSEDIGTLETIIRNLLKDYRDDPKIDMYTLHWNSISKYVKYICDIFHGTIIPFTNDFIINNIEINDEPVSPEKINIKDIEEQDNQELVEIEDDTSSETAEPQENEQDTLSKEEESEKTIKTITNEVINRTVETIETTKTTSTQRLFKCKPCGEYKSYKFFGENIQTNKRHTRCIKCRNIKNVRLQINATELTIYKCLGCLEEKDLEEFDIKEERNELCRECIENNIPKKEIIEISDPIVYKHCNHCKNRYNNSKFFIKNNGEISWICLDCMKHRFELLVTIIKDNLKKTPRNYKSKLLNIIENLLNDLTLHDVFGKREIKELGNYRRCLGNHVHEIDRWQLIDEFALVNNGRENISRTNNCKKCRQA